MQPKAVSDTIARLKSYPQGDVSLEIYQFLLWDILENVGIESGLLDTPDISQEMMMDNLSKWLDCDASYRTRQESVKYILQWVLHTQTLTLELKMLLLDFDAQWKEVSAAASGLGVDPLLVTLDDLKNLGVKKPQPKPEPETISLELLMEQLRAMSKQFSGAWENAEFLESLYATQRNQLWQSIDKEGVDAVLAHLNGLLTMENPYVVTRFLEEFKCVQALKTPKINWMQAYAIYWMLHHDSGINISEPGTGKTWTAPLIAMALNAHITVIIAPKGTFAEENSQVEREIACVETEGEYAIHKHYARKNCNKLVKRLSLTKRNYIITNPEQFQLDTDKVVQTIISLNPDLLVIDEFQFFMSKTDDDVMKKRLDRMVYLLQNLPKTKKYFMSATPYRTDVAEPVSVLKYIQNDQLDRLKGRESRSIGMKLRTEFLKGGFRFLNNDQRMPKLHFKILPYHVSTETATQIANPLCSTLQKECILARTRAEMLELVTLDNIPSNPVHYSTWVDAQGGHLDDGPIEVIKEFLGGKAPLCVGNDDRFEVWKKKKGALVASWPFATGRDGAQDISDTMFIWATPPTGTGLQQLIGRILRPPSKRSGRNLPMYKDVYVYYPLALNVSYDVERYKRLLKRDDFLRLIQDGPAYRPIYKTDAQIEAHLAELRLEVDTQLARRQSGLATKLGVVPTEPTKTVMSIRRPQSKKFHQARSILTQFHSYIARLGGDRTKQVIEAGFMLNGVAVTEALLAELEREWAAERKLHRPPQERLIQEVIVPQPDKRAILVGCGCSSLPDESLPHDITLLDYFIDHPRILKRNMTNTGLPDASFDTLISVLSLYKKDAAGAIRKWHAWRHPEPKSGLSRLTRTPEMLGT
jgi:hypothetical protein